jgi:hypothetical protein
MNAQGSIDSFVRREDEYEQVLKLTIQYICSQSQGFPSRVPEPIECESKQDGDRTAVPCCALFGNRMCRD